jgi:hypothetical protein
VCASAVASSTAFRHTAVDEHDVARRTDADTRDAARKRFVAVGDERGVASTSAAPSQ